jgi:membrane protein YqaA with SNARE-associated domain
MEMAAPLVAALWGFAEATLFFIVPDVFLTVVALRDRRAGFRGCAAAIVGALAGGLLMYLWGSTDPASADAAVGGVPGISHRMAAQVRSSLLSTGLLSLFLGPLTGTPYKIYAVTSGALGLSLPLFLLISIPARGARFLIVTLAASWASHHPLAAWSLGRKRAVAVALWIVFYAVYFAVKR